MSKSGPLTVRATVRVRQKTTEARFEARVAEILKELGLFSYHVAERWYQGIPDRYIVGGNWLELKAVPFAGTRRINPVRFFSPQQQNFLDKFAASGDRTWACVLFQPDEGDPWCVLLPWWKFQEHGSWDMDEIKEHGVKARGDTLRDYVAARFGIGYDGFSNWYKE